MQPYFTTLDHWLNTSKDDATSSAVLNCTAHLCNTVTTTRARWATTLEGRRQPQLANKQGTQTQRHVLDAAHGWYPANLSMFSGNLKVQQDSGVTEQVKKKNAS